MTNGTIDSQNSRCRLAHIDAPETRVRGVQHVVVVVPVDADVDEAQDVGEEVRQRLAQGVQILAVRHLQLEDEDRDDDGEHAIAECFESTFAHAITPAAVYFARAPSQASRIFSSSGVGVSPALSRVTSVRVGSPRSAIVA